MSQPAPAPTGSAAVIPLRTDRPATDAEAVEACLRSAGIAASSQRIYRISLLSWAVAGRRPATAARRARRGAVPPAVAFTALGETDGTTPAADVLAAAFAQRARLVDADTVDRELSVLRAAVTWWRGRGWPTGNPIIGIERRPAPPDRTRALSREQIAALFALKAAASTGASGASRRHPHRLERRRRWLHLGLLSEVAGQPLEGR
ncbi:hypothetical protein [Nonomuraea sp. SYSU D8015]|uniref:hypothetical protein n=1 Tax=Nonomuraea sp. SYSU D8015 TaxID=2593644 RepID=UPI0016615140|nr:hypothetical protein [Nonomuraea sp. SYSU D8015]